jgi:hypothetical protein
MKTANYYVPLTLPEMWVRTIERHFPGETSKGFIEAIEDYIEKNLPPKAHINYLFPATHPSCKCAVTVPPGLYKELRDYALNTGRSPSQVIYEAVARKVLSYSKGRLKSG